MRDIPRGFMHAFMHAEMQHGANIKVDPSQLTAASQRAGNSPTGVVRLPDCNWNSIMQPRRVSTHKRGLQVNSDRQGRIEENINPKATGNPTWGRYVFPSFGGHFE